MILKQFDPPCLAHASYLIADEQTGTAAVVDPQRDTDQYIAFATEDLFRSNSSNRTRVPTAFLWRGLRNFGEPDCKQKFIVSVIETRVGCQS
jgi:hypothetical protein